MDKIEKIRQEIERLYDSEAISKWLDTLSEELDKSLEEAAYKYSFDSRPSIYGQVDVIDAFKAGAEWQKSQIIEDAVEGEVYLYHSYNRDATAILVDIPKENLGDKVRIVVLKEEE